jgi:hypothetical protein
MTLLKKGLSREKPGFFTSGDVSLISQKPGFFQRTQQSVSEKKWRQVCCSPNPRYQRDIL